jgi:hypothetical protein
VTSRCTCQLTLSGPKYPRSEGVAIESMLRGGRENEG